MFGKVITSRFGAGTIFEVHIFYKQRVYKPLALGWQISKQLSGLNPLSISNNKNYRLKKSGVLPF